MEIDHGEVISSRSLIFTTTCNSFSAPGELYNPIDRIRKFWLPDERTNEYILRFLSCDPLRSLPGMRKLTFPRIMCEKLARPRMHTHTHDFVYTYMYNQIG